MQLLRIEHFFPNAFAAGVHSKVFPNAPAGLFFVNDSLNNVSVPTSALFSRVTRSLSFRPMKRVTLSITRCPARALRTLILQSFA